MDGVNYDTKWQVILAGAARRIGAAQSTPQLSSGPQRGADYQPLWWTKAPAIIVAGQTMLWWKGNWAQDLRMLRQIHKLGKAIQRGIRAVNGGEMHRRRKAYFASSS